MKRPLFLFLVIFSMVSTMAEKPDEMVARIFDREISASEIRLKFDAEGNPILPADPATCLRTNAVAELKKLIFLEMQQEVVRSRNLGATAEELAELAEFQEAFMARDRVRRRKDLEKYEMQLAEGGLSTEEHERMEQHLNTLRSLAEHDKRLETMPKPTPEMLRMIHAPFIEAWKYHMAIYEEFGGVVISTKFGPDPVQAKALLAQKLAEEGHLDIPSRAMQEALWVSFFPDPKLILEEEKIDFTPFWKQPLPQDEPGESGKPAGDTGF